jgi:hypothetical protein
MGPRMIRPLLTAIALSATPAAAQYPSNPPITVTDPFGTTLQGPWICRITDQGGVPQGGERNTMTVHEASDREIRFTVSHRYSVNYPWGIRSYNACNFGAGRNARPLKAWPARQLKQAGKLEQHFSFNIERTSGDFNILAETFLTGTATDNSIGLLEVGFHLYENRGLNDWLKQRCRKADPWPCTPGAYRAKGIGTFTDRRGMTWLVVMAPGPNGPRGYAVIRPLKPVTTGTLPWGEAFAFLVKAKVAHPDWWMRGAFFGVEVIKGEASVRVSRLSGLTD